MKTRRSTLAVLSAATLLISSMHVTATGVEGAYASTFACNDGDDNDHDGGIDYPLDGGCESPNDQNEGPGIYANRDPRWDLDPRPAPLLVTVTDGRSFAEPGDVLHYDITVQNPTDTDRAIALRVAVPAELSLEATTGNPVVDVRSLIWPEVLVAGGQSVAYSFAARIAPGSPDLQALHVTAYADEAKGSDTTSVYRGVVPAAFSVSATDGIAEAAPGDDIDYTITIKNEDTGLATGVDVHVSLPQYTEFIGADQGGSWTGNGVFWKGLTVSPKGERVIGLRLRVRSDAPIGAVIQFVAAAKGQQGVDRTKVSQTKEEAPREIRSERLVLRKSANRTDVRPGEQLIYTVYLRNTTDAAIHNVVVEDRMDRRYMRVVSGDTGSVAGDRTVWNLGTLAPGASWQAQYTVEISADAPHGTELQNVVSVSGDGMEEISLTQRVYMSTVNVVGRMPPTGAPMVDLGMGLVAGLASALSTFATQRMRRMAA